VLVASCVPPLILEDRGELMQAATPLLASMNEKEQIWYWVPWNPSIEEKRKSQWAPGGLQAWPESGS